jgi:hypothetical protein
MLLKESIMDYFKKPVLATTVFLAASVGLMGNASAQSRTYLYDPVNMTLCPDTTHFCTDRSKPIDVNLVMLLDKNQGVLRTDEQKIYEVPARPAPGVIVVDVVQMQKPPALPEVPSQVVVRVYPRDVAPTTPPWAYSPK